MSVRGASPSTWNVVVTVIGRKIHEVQMPDPDVPRPAVLNRELNDALRMAAPNRGDQGFILFEESVIPRGSRYSTERWVRQNAGARFGLQGTRKIAVGPGGKVIPYVVLSLAIFFGISRLDSLLDRSHA